jgi:hypothetical protein
MRFSEFVVLIFGAMIVAGCQTSPGTTEPFKPYESFSTSKTQSQYFTDETTKAGDELGRALVANCMSSGQLNALDACFRQRTSDAFQTPESGVKACQDLQDMDKYIECIAMGSVNDSLRQRISAAHSPAMQATDWRRPEDYMKRLMKGEIQDLTDKCLQGSLDSINQCMRQELVRFSSVSDEHLQTCASISDSEKFGNCLGEAVGLEFLQSAIGRLRDKSAALSRQPALQVAERAL